MWALRNTAYSIMLRGSTGKRWSDPYNMTGYRCRQHSPTHQRLHKQQSIQKVFRCRRNLALSLRHAGGERRQGRVVTVDETNHDRNQEKSETTDYFGLVCNIGIASEKFREFLLLVG